jgi:hypothetical protein
MSSGGGGGGDSSSIAVSHLTLLIRSGKNSIKFAPYFHKNSC